MSYGECCRKQSPCSRSDRADPARRGAGFRHVAGRHAGRGGYTRRLLEAGADTVIGVDRDPLAIEMAEEWADDRVKLVQGTFSKLDEYGQDLDGVVLDLGVSSMQLDRAERGFPS